MPPPRTMSNLKVDINIPHPIIAPLASIQKQLKNQDIHIHITAENIKLSNLKNCLPSLTLGFSKQKEINTLNRQLVKALNIKKIQQQTIKIVDLTAGFGRDSLTLSSLNHPLISIEKNPITAAILKTLVAQYKQLNPKCQWEVICTCSDAWLKTQKNQKPTHLYMDPFFEKKTSALPKKDMQWLHHLNRNTEINDEEALFTSAIENCLDRVVVKRDKRANFIANKKPNQGSILQKTSRFDCYKI